MRRGDCVETRAPIVSRCCCPVGLPATREAARMKKANRTMARYRQRFMKRRARGNRMGTLRVKLRWLVIGCATIAGLGLFAARNGAETVDSGWAVAVPSPLAKGARHTDQDLVLRHVLEQSHQPILQTAPKVQPAVTDGNPTDGGVRFANRPEKEKATADGWRSALAAGPSLAPARQDQATAEAAPAATPSTAPAKRSYGFEVECHGAGEVVSDEPEAARPQSAGPSLATPATADEAPQENQPIEDAAREDDERAARVEAGNSREADSSEEAAPVSPPVRVAPAAIAPRIEKQITPITSAKTAPATTPAVAKPPAADITPVTDLPPLSRQMISLRSRVRTVLKGYYRKALASRENDPWEVMHGMLAYGVHSRIHEGNQNGQLITSVGWLCYNKPCKGQTLLYVTPSGELRAKYGVGLQGHLGQFLAMLAQCHVSPDYPIRVGDNQFTIADLIEAEKKTCYPKSELTFKLIALQHYADLDDKWVNDQGVEWDFPRLISEELAQPIRGAACGGTHRLSGLSLVVKARQARGEPLDGEYQKANEFVKKYQQYAFRLQNRDGSLSTSWFRGAGDEDDDDRRIKTTGHILEWLCYSLSDEQLREPHTVRAVTYLANLMYSNYDHEWEIGPRSHATHALLLYDQRVFQPYDKDGEMASYRPNTTVARKGQPRGNSNTGTFRR